MEFIYLDLGLACDKIIINPFVTEKPCLNPTVDPIDKGISNLYPASAVTWTMSNKVSDNTKHTVTDLHDNNFENFQNYLLRTCV